MTLSPYTAFGQTKLIPVKIYHQGKLTQEGEWDRELWIERAEDWYALSPLKNERVRVIERDVWLSRK